MSIQRHNVVISRDDGGIEIFPMKEWLRLNPDILPEIDVRNNTSHRIRSMLRAKGWQMHELSDEIRMLKPGFDQNTANYSEILGSSSGEEIEESQSPYFSLEYQLRDFLASNLNTVSINGRRLKLYIDPTGRDGVEYPSAVGPIDMLAVDEQGSFFVFELKRAAGSDRAMGQLARYMGWVKKTVGQEKDVFGVIVAKNISSNLRYAASIVPHVYLFEYEVSFQLNAAHQN